MVAIAAMLATCALACQHAARVHSPGEVYVAAILFEGNTAIPSGDLLGGLALQRSVDEPRDVDPFQIQSDTARVAGAFYRLGFFTAQVTPRVERSGDARTIIFKIVEGPRARVASVSFLG